MGLLLFVLDSDFPIEKRIKDGPGWDLVEGWVGGTWDDADLWCLAITRGGQGKKNSGRRAEGAKQRRGEKEMAGY